MTGEKKAKKELLIIIPAYNEANNITKLLEKLESPEIAEIADVLIMNDASSDDTNWIVKARNHAIVTHVFNLGYGSALQLGYKYAIRRGYEYVIQMDADGQHDVCNIPVIYEKLKTKDENGKYPDIVLGSRFMEGSSEFPVSFLKKIAWGVFRGLIYLGTGRKIADPTTGLQGLSRRVVIFYSTYNHFDDKYPDAREYGGSFQCPSRLVPYFPCYTGGKVGSGSGRDQSGRRRYTGFAGNIDSGRRHRRAGLAEAL